MGSGFFKCDMKPEIECRLDADGNILPTSKCPECHYEMDAGTVCDEKAEKNTRPKPGDVSVCIKCGAIMEYSGDMMLKALDLDLLDDDDTKFQLRRLQQHIRKPK